MYYPAIFQFQLQYVATCIDYVFTVLSQLQCVATCTDYVFNVLFQLQCGAPCIEYMCLLSCFSYNVELFVQSALGGQWRFPLQFIATEAAPDDTIVVETAGLNKESSVGFRLFSQTRYI